MNKSAQLYSILSFLSFYLVYISSNSIFAVFGILIFIASGISLLAYLESPIRTKRSDIISVVIFAVFVLFIIGLSMNNGILEKAGLSVNEKNMQSWWMPVYIIIVFLPIYVLYRNRKAEKPLYIPVLIFAFVPALIIGLVLILFSDLRNNAIEIVANIIQISMIDVLETAKNTSGLQLPESYLNILSYLSQYKMDVAKQTVFFVPSGIASVFLLMVYMCDRLKPLIKDNMLTIREYKLPDNLVWALIVGGFLILIKQEGIKYISYNVIAIFAILYFFQGIQVINRFFEYYKVSFFMRSLLFLFIIFYFQVFAVLVILTGLFSIWFKPKFLSGNMEDVKKDNQDNNRDNNNEPRA